MKKNLIFIFCFVLILKLAGQTNNQIPENRQHQIQVLKNLIKNNDIIELSERVAYPILRPNPIPDIKTKEQFILYYPVLFDSILKSKLTTTNFNSSNTIDYYNGFGLLRGILWLNDDGFIKSINYNSKQEATLLQQLHEETKNKIHYSVKEWKSNILVCKTDRFLIRIDRLNDNSIRYISWSNSHDISKQPDLILMNGKIKRDGTMGNITYSFQNKNWTYTIERVNISESDDHLGLYLRVYNNGTLKLNNKTEKIK